ncbi:MAG: phosphatase PAP2 family protein [Ignavibacteriales bacterium]|nr:phosphatase PAP2 family protein [Ignavibacteriales bacterium]
MRRRSESRIVGRFMLCCFFFFMHTVAWSQQQPVDSFKKPADTLLATGRQAVVISPADSTTLPLQQPTLKWHSMITNLPGDWKQYFTLKFQTNRIPEFVGLGVLTAGLIVTDAATYEVSDRWYKNSQTVSDVSNFFVSLGDGKSQFALAGAFAAYGLLKDDNRALRTGSQIVQAVLASGAVVQVLKHITGRESPFVRTSPLGTWRFFPDQIDYHKRVPAYDAFPSGHICTALATVIVIAENYPETTWIRPVGYIISGLVGVGMVNRGIHWYSDYPLGLAIGYAFGMIAAHPEGILSAGPVNENAPHVSIAPAVNGNGVGLSMAIVF